MVQLFINQTSHVITAKVNATLTLVALVCVVPTLQQGNILHQIPLSVPMARIFYKASSILHALASRIAKMYAVREVLAVTLCTRTC